MLTCKFQVNGKPTTGDSRYPATFPLRTPQTGTGFAFGISTALQLMGVQSGIWPWGLTLNLVDVAIEQVPDT